MQKPSTGLEMPFRDMSTKNRGGTCTEIEYGEHTPFIFTKDKTKDENILLNLIELELIIDGKMERVPKFKILMKQCQVIVLKTFLSLSLSLSLSLFGVGGW